MRLTEKSQVTIPKRVREALDIGPGSEVDFTLDEAGARLIKVLPAPSDETRGRRIVRLLRAAGQRSRRNEFSVDEIMELTRGPFDDVHPRR